MPRAADRNLLFGARATSGFTLWTRGKKALDARLGDAVVGVAAARLAAQHGDPHDREVERRTAPRRGGSFGHHSHRSGVAGVYNRATYAAQIKRALSLWSDYVLSLVEGGERKVVALSGPRHLAEKTLNPDNLM